MIDYDTILSTTEDKMTLLQWLKKVEAALKDASATAFKVNKKGDATLTFSIEFADGTTLESGEIILQQGESVESAAIVNGHLILTLTNGDELDAGDLGAVSSFEVNASQHLIIHYQDGTTADLGSVAVNLENIEDANGHKRFIEEDGVPMTSRGFTSSYCKWSLSGTHLMLVLAGEFQSGADIPSGIWATYALPQWVGDKIFPVFAGSRIEVKDVILYNVDWSTDDTQPAIVLTKDGSTYITMQNIKATAAATKDRSFRVQFDLLIDNA